MTIGKGNKTERQTNEIANAQAKQRPCFACFDWSTLVPLLLIVRLFYLKGERRGVRQYVQYF